MRVPPLPGATSRGPHSAQHPAGHARQWGSTGSPHAHTCAHGTRAADPDHPLPGRAAGRGWAPNLRRASRRRQSPPRGCPHATPTARKSARCWAGAGSPRLHHPRLQDGQPRERERLSPDAPHNGEKSPHPGGNLSRNTHHGAQTWATRPGCPPHRWAAGGGRAPDTRRPSQQ